MTERTDSLVSPQLKLDKETMALLDDIRRSDRPLVVYGTDPETCDRIIHELTDPILEGAALPTVVLNQFRWFVRELGKLFRTRTGFDLGFNLELVLRKWQSYNLEPRSMQLLLKELYTRLLRMTPAPEAEDGKPEEA